jgi:cob(I)alamin adenosyltransferase
MSEDHKPATTTATVDPRPPGLLLVYTGNGKGKTTAALGLVFRALGRKLPVAVVQFIKGKWKTGERLFAETLAETLAETPIDDAAGAPGAPREAHPGLTFLVMGKGFTWESDDLSRDKQAAQAAWAKARALIEAGAHTVVVLDELTYVLNYGFVPTEQVLATLRDRPRHVNVVVTGRNAPQALMDAADLVTEMKSLKHPFEQGRKAQIGIDY